MLSTLRKNPNRAIKHFAVKAPLALFMLTVLISACGKRGAPIPPSERVKQRVELQGYQRGNQVILSWKMPTRNAPKGNVQNIARIDIYRLAEPVTAPQTMSEDDFANRSTLIAAMPITDADFGANKTLQFKDTLQFAGQAARLRYAARVVNGSGQKAAFSNTLLIEPTSKVAGGPSSLSANISQDAVGLKWQAPTTNIDGSTPVSILGYNVYRSESETKPARLLNKTPITTTQFDDEFFDFGKEYFYFIRSVSAGVQAEPVESVESNILKVKPVDTFAPSAPAAITLAAAPATLSIFFAVNPEKDIATYNIYRSETQDEPLDKWTLITPNGITANTYQDTRVESGKKYFYYITATDKFGNTSSPSEVVSETVP